jgi:hypothetical protein
MAQIEANQGQDRRVASSYYCHNCNSSNCLTIQRRRIDNIHVLFNSGVVAIVVLNGKIYGHLMVNPYGLRNIIVCNNQK